MSTVRRSTESVRSGAAEFLMTTPTAPYISTLLGIKDGSYPTFNPESDLGVEGSGNGNPVKLWIRSGRFIGVQL